MEFIKEESAGDLLQTHTHIWNQAFSLINSMSLKCAVQLGIPDIMYNHGQPMTLSELVAALPIDPSKAQYVYRLMRFLVNSGFFAMQDKNSNQECYFLTPASYLLLKDSPLSMRSYLLVALDPILTKPWDLLSTWFKNDDPTSTPFSAAHGKTFWEYAGQEPILGDLFNDSMAYDSILVSKVVISNCKGIFEGLKSLVDVGGGTGTMAKAISEAFPQLECSVFDLSQVVSNLQGSKNLKYLGGDMFDAIPPADAILLKWIMHNWSDANCVKILKNCREAIIKNNSKGGKVIVIDIVLGYQNQDKESIETQLFYDLEMMVLVNGRQRNEIEWAKLFFDAGFSNYKINPILGLRSLIEVFPF